VRWGVGALAAVAAVGLTTGSPSPATAGSTGPPSCAPGGALVVITGEVSTGDAKTYRVLPFEVMPGTTRVEVGYEWADDPPPPGTPVDAFVETVLDLGLWDEGGVGRPEGFRGWSGSRQGRVADGQDPIWVQADSAERGYRPDPVRAGTWHVDLGIATVSPQGAAYTVTVRCLAPPVGAAVPEAPVDAAHVANDDPGWYHGDFHMHGRHSNASAPEWDEFVQFARDAGLDFFPVTDYVTNQHHRELGPIQEANPDVLIWPGREVITYFGHATVFGETPHEVDWRHGFGDVTLGDIQADSVADGALFGIAHPTLFPTPLLNPLCRGCEFTLGDEIDWDAVTTMEVLTGPVLVDDTQIGGPGLGFSILQPFVPTAIDLWEEQLLAGHRVTAVSGSDDKLGPDLGSSATAVYAEELSRAGLTQALRAGHAYVRTRGVADSPELDLLATAADGQTGIFGDTLRSDAAEVTVEVRRAAGQLLVISRDGTPIDVRPIEGDDDTHTFTATRDPGSGPLGTFWRVDTVALGSATHGPYLTTIANPVFLADPEPSAPPSPPPPGGEDPGGAPASDGATLPATGGSATVPLAAVTLLAAVLVIRCAARASR
jgi:hypothetical protein